MCHFVICRCAHSGDPLKKKVWKSSPLNSKTPLKYFSFASPMMTLYQWHGSQQSKLKCNECSLLMNIHYLLECYWMLWCSCSCKVSAKCSSYGFSLNIILLCFQAGWGEHLQYAWSRTQSSPVISTALLGKCSFLQSFVVFGFTKKMLFSSKLKSSTWKWWFCELPKEN